MTTIARPDAAKRPDVDALRRLLDGEHHTVTERAA